MAYFQPNYYPVMYWNYPGAQLDFERYPVARNYFCPTCGQPTDLPVGVQIGGQLGAFGVGVNTGAHLGGGQGIGAHLGGNLGSHNGQVGFQFGGR